MRSERPIWTYVLRMRCLFSVCPSFHIHLSIYPFIENIFICIMYMCIHHNEWLCSREYLVFQTSFYFSLFGFKRILTNKQKTIMICHLLYHIIIIIIIIVHPDFGTVSFFLASGSVYRICRLTLFFFIIYFSGSSLSWISGASPLLCDHYKYKMDMDLNISLSRFIRFLWLFTLALCLFICICALLIFFFYFYAWCPMLNAQCMNICTFIFHFSSMLESSWWTKEGLLLYPCNWMMVPIFIIIY